MFDSVSLSTTHESSISQGGTITGFLVNVRIVRIRFSKSKTKLTFTDSSVLGDGIGPSELPVRGVSQLLDLGTRSIPYRFIFFHR
ncbi:MAG: hypothetical protein V3U73_12130, partial [bacterium]